MMITKSKEEQRENKSANNSAKLDYKIWKETY